MLLTRSNVCRYVQAQLTRGGIPSGTALTLGKGESPAVAVSEAVLGGLTAQSPFIHGVIDLTEFTSSYSVAVSIGASPGL